MVLWEQRNHKSGYRRYRKKFAHIHHLIEFEEAGCRVTADESLD